MLKELTEHGHPNVIRFFSICKMEAPVAGWGIVTEYLSNGSLKSFLELHGATLKRFQLLAFAKAAAAGMLHLASQQPPVLHRDLSARNLLVGDVSADGIYALRVADFGLARAGDDYSIGSSPSPTRWTAPEVWASRHFTLAADVWSFGVTLWEIFQLGKRPYEGMDDREVLRRVREGHVLPQEVHGRSIPSDTYALIVECLQMDPIKRPSWKTIHIMLEALEMDARRLLQ